MSCCRYLPSNYPSPHFLFHFFQLPTLHLSSFTDVASAGTSLSENQFIYSVCTDVFSQPVTIPCGHSFCIACISKYWDSNDFCNCPVCKMSFETKPDVCMNTLMTEFATYFRKSAEVRPAGNDRLKLKPVVGSVLRCV